MIKRFLLLTVSLISCISAFPQSLLWEITGKGFEKPSYLYGTIHIQDKRVFAFDSVVYEKINFCDAFAMEVLM
ncbi:MAG TPA: TraB/GumN family protein, partial [Bacteroidales bacterium]|nr:TraB/GumN family protein [Bacteroidales bacterium]